MDELTRRAEKANCVIGDSTRDEWETQQFLIFKRLKSNDPHHFSEEEFQKYIIARFSTIQQSLFQTIPLNGIERIVRDANANYFIPEPLEMDLIDEGGKIFEEITPMDSSKIEQVYEKRAFNCVFPIENI